MTTGSGADHQGFNGYLRRRAAGLLGFANGLLVATDTTLYGAEIEGIGALLADPQIHDQEALARAGAAFGRLRQAMATSRDQFYLLHADKAMQNRINDRFEAAFDELTGVFDAAAGGG